MLRPWSEIERERLAAIEEWNREIASIRKDRGDPIGLPRDAEGLNSSIESSTLHRQ